MDTTEFYRQLIGIESPWRVADVSLDLTAREVTLLVEHGDGALACSCGRTCGLHDHAEERCWRHLDTCQMKTFIRCRLPRTRCEECGVKTVAPSWAAPRGRFTLLFEAFMIELLRATGRMSRVAALLDVSGAQVALVRRRAVNRGMARRGDDAIRRLCIDEKSMSRGQTYLTVLGDPGRGRVLDVCETRRGEEVRALLERALPEHRREAVECITMDMWEPFMTAAVAKLPKADIVHDRFHVSMHLNGAVDRVRRRENRRLAKKDGDALKGSKYLFLRNRENVRIDRLDQFERAREASKETAAIWRFKELFRSFFDCMRMAEARSFLANWYRRARRQGIPELTKVAKTILGHAKGILAYITHRVTNAAAEGINAKIQALKASARGFRSFVHYRNNILFHLGGLDLMPRKSE
jgi:transposase